jgi:hypothetical protein
VNLQKTCRWVPTCPLWSNDLFLEDLLFEEGERRLLELGENFRSLASLHLTLYKKRNFLVRRLLLDSYLINRFSFLA